MTSLAISPRGLRAVRALVAALLFAGLPFLSFSQWSRVDVNGVQVCRDASSGATFQPPYASKSQVTVACNTLTAFLPWLGTAEAQSIRISRGGAVPSATTIPPGTPPVAGQWQSTSVGDSAVGSHVENSISDITITARGSEDGLGGTANDIDGAIAYLPSQTGDVEIKFSPNSMTDTSSAFAFGGCGVIDASATIDGNVPYAFTQVPFSGFGASESAAKSKATLGGTNVVTTGPATAFPGADVWGAFVQTGGQHYFFIAPDVADSPGTWTLIDQRAESFSSWRPACYYTSHNNAITGTFGVDHISISSTITLVGGGGGGGGGGSFPQAPWTYALLMSFDGQQMQDANTRAACAKFKACIITGFYESAFDGQPLTKDQVVDDIHSRAATNGTGTLVFNYVNFNEEDKDNSVGGAAGFAATLAVINLHNCWSYLNGKAGSIAPSTWNANYELVNVTQNCKGMGQPDTVMQDMADLYNDLLFNTGGSFSSAMASPDLDGLMLDNQFREARQSWDFDADGSTDSHSDSDFISALRAGWDEWRNRMKSLQPSKRFGGNPDFYMVSSTTPLGDLGDLSFLESITGVTWSIPTFYTGAQVLGTMSRAVQQDAANAYVMFNFATSDPISTDEWREMNYYCGLAHLVGGLCNIESTVGSNHPGYTIHGGDADYVNRGAAWAVQFQNSSYNWMGNPVGSAITCNVSTLSCPGNYQNADTYIREFQNAYVVCNLANSFYDVSSYPKPAPGTDNKVITLPVNVHEISGGQQTVDNGQSYTAGNNITIPERTCQFLIKG